MSFIIRVPVIGAMTAGETQPRLSVVGLGKLGLCVAVACADAGFSVVGVDVDAEKVRSVNAGLSPIFEPGLQEALSRAHPRLSASGDLTGATRATDVSFVVVPTPSDSQGGFSLDLVLPAIEGIGQALRTKPGYHLVVLTSTVMPGSMGGPVLNALERSSGKKVPSEIGLCYNPEFIALGEVLSGLTRPDFLLIGESDPRAGDLLTSVQRRITDGTADVCRMNFVNAELAKLAINSFVTMKISFANTIAGICERISGLDVDVVTAAIGRDQRIGPRYLKGGLGFGGPCFPRDNLAFAKLATDVGAQALLAQATQAVNVGQVNRLVERIERVGIPPSARVSVLGITYKPNTDVTEASQAMELAIALAKRGYAVRAYDPSLSSRVPGAQIDGVKIEPTVQACLDQTQLCVIATPWKEFHEPHLLDAHRCVVVDCWRVLDENGGRTASGIIAIGRKSSDL